MSQVQKTILIVDDENNIVTMLGSRLKKKWLRRPVGFKWPGMSCRN